MLAGRWWLPGMNRAGGETPPASFGKRTALHHLISAGNIGYAAWRDGGFTVHDLSDPANPKLLEPSQLLPPPFGGGAHTPLPLPGRKLLVLADEATSANCANGLAYTWVIDVREPSNPVSIATLPTPAEEDFCAKGAKFGPHNLHENRPGSFVRPKTSSSPPTTMRACAFTMYATPSSRRRSAISCRRRRRKLSIMRPNPAQGHPVLRRLCRHQRPDVSDRHQCGPLHPAIRRTCEVIDG